MKTTTFLSGVVAGMAFLLAGVNAIDGVATYYSQFGVAGSCGVYHKVCLCPSLLSLSLSPSSPLPLPSLHILCLLVTFP